MVLVFVVAAGTSVIYLRIQAESDARQAAVADARYAAGIAAADIAGEVVTLQKTAAALAANPQVPMFLAKPGPGCTLTFSGAGSFSSGHLDIIEPDGSVICSSRPLPASAIYSDDPTEGGAVVVAAAPVAGIGVVAAFATLSPLGSNLAVRFGGSRQLSFVVTTANQQIVLADSSSSSRVGTSLANSPFPRAAASGEGKSLDGRDMLFGQSVVAGQGWRVDAGANLAAALTNANRLENLELAIIGGGLLAMLGVALIADQRISTPIRQLSVRIASASAQDSGDPVPLRGPAEVQALAETFNQMMASVKRELGERRRAEEQAKTSERDYRLLFDSSPVPMMFTSPSKSTILDVNDAATAAYGYSRDEFTKLSVKDIYVSKGEDEQNQVMSSPQEGFNFVRSGPLDQRKKNGTIMRTLVTSHEVTHNGQVARFSTIEDITERQRLERAVNQSQRLESLGQLAGGVAHDFNNLIGIILNFALFAKERLETSAEGRPDHVQQLAIKDMERVVRAGESAARLTHQLLAFARREVMQPQPLNVNQVLTEVEPLLHRTLGEHIDFLTPAAKGLWPALMDPGQLEQVLTNLAINARDAMPRGGQLTIDCENVNVDDAYAAGRPGLKPGRFVRIRVTDTGVGMNEQTLQRVFEPFFTTKPKGQGTGLGLATVYGIVNQAGGYVSIYSEVGMGTRVHVLLPASDEAPKPSETTAPPTRGQASGTILVVEDAEDLREITNLILTKNGYHVMSASNGRDALEVAKDYDGTIDLLLTDVVMPQMQGKELVERIAISRPGTRILYMSGYAEPILGEGGTLERGVLLLEKPFTEPALIAKVEQALRAPLAVLAPGPVLGA